MSRNYDNWERLVEAVLDREKLRQLAREDSLDSITSDFSSPFSFDSTLHGQYVPGPEALPKPFSYDELKKATRNFQSVRFLGGGGTWYDSEGWIDEHTLTAVKLISERFLDLNEWMSKVNYLGRLRHPNLVKLMGYCSEAQSRFLVYEFIPRGSLEMKLLEYEFLPRRRYLEMNLLEYEFLPRRRYMEMNLLEYEFMPRRRDLEMNLLEYEFMPRRRDLEMDSSGTKLNQILSWETRVNVAIDVARALSFLHDRKSPVIHRHVKASMVLLDEDFNAKLDIFPNELDPHDQYVKAFNRANTLRPDVRRGYHWPRECVLTGKVTDKTDVYSFGVVLLQLLSGLPASNQLRVPGNRNLVHWAKPYLLDKRKLYNIMDPNLRNQYSNKEACSLATISLQCLSEEPKLRPSMTKVLADLERAAQMKLQKQKSRSRE